MFAVCALRGRFYCFVSFQIADFIQAPHQNVAAAVLKEERGGKAKRKFNRTPTSEHKALQNWHRNMAIRRRQETFLGGEGI